MLCICFGKLSRWRGKKDEENLIKGQVEPLEWREDSTKIRTLNYFLFVVKWWLKKLSEVPDVFQTNIQSRRWSKNFSCDNLVVPETKKTQVYDLNRCPQSLSFHFQNAKHINWFSCDKTWLFIFWPKINEFADLIFGWSFFGLTFMNAKHSVPQSHHVIYVA